MYVASQLLIRMGLSLSLQYPPGKPGPVELVEHLTHAVCRPLNIPSLPRASGIPPRDKRGQSKSLRMDSHGHPDRIHGIHLCLGQEITAVYKADAYYLTAVLSGIRPFQADERIELVAAVSPHAVYALDSPGEVHDSPHSVSLHQAPVKSTIW